MQHQPFKLDGGEAGALLVHGFPGTPAEMRPLGETLQAAGWTVQGLLLPGFGPQFSELQEKKMEDWIQVIDAALEAMFRDYHPVLLVGYSMGGGLSIQAAAPLFQVRFCCMRSMVTSRSGWKISQILAKSLGPSTP